MLSHKAVGVPEDNGRFGSAMDSACLFHYGPYGDLSKDLRKNSPISLATDSRKAHEGGTPAGGGPGEGVTTE